MIAVIFEVWPSAEAGSAYFDLAAQLREQLAVMDGFVSIERFSSLSEPGKFLSLSFWRDESAVSAWRNHKDHRSAQRAGREGVLADYRVRIASVVRDYRFDDRAQAPEDSRELFVQ